ncbi:MAG: hypothetical protein ACYC1M_15595 [Armatimonadota bacterium]
MVAEANGSTLTKYTVRVLGDELVMRYNGTDLHSTLFLTDAIGVQTDKYGHNAWTRAVSYSGTTVSLSKYIVRSGYYYMYKLTPNGVCNMPVKREPASSTPKPAYREWVITAVLAIGFLLVLSLAPLLKPLVLILCLIILAVGYLALARRAGYQGAFIAKCVALALIVAILGGVMIKASPLTDYMTEVRNTEKLTNCLTNTKFIGLAMMMYSDDYDGKLPPVKNWQPDIRAYVKSKDGFNCPSAKDKRYSYGMNNTIGKTPLQNIEYPETTAMVFDCSLPRLNASGSRKAVDFRHRKDGKNIALFVFADGHAARVYDKKPNVPHYKSADQVRWAP